MRVLAAQVVDVQGDQRMVAKPWKNSCANWASKPPIIPDLNGTFIVRLGRPEKSTTTRDSASSSGT